MGLNTKHPRSEWICSCFLMYILIYFFFLSTFILRNGADVAHLAHLHGPSMLGGSDLTFIDKSNCPGKLNGTSAPILHHHWEVGWQGPEHGAADCHIAVTTIKHDLRLFGRIPFILMEVEAKQIGPGLVYLTLGTSLGRCVLVQTVTPIAPFTQRVLHRLYASPTVIAPYAKLILWGEAIQVFIHQMVLVNFITFNWNWGIVLVWARRGCVEPQNLH